MRVPSPAKRMLRAATEEALRSERIHACVRPRGLAPLGFSGGCSCVHASACQRVSWRLATCLLR